MRARAPQRAYAVLVEASLLVTHAGLVVDLVLVRLKSPHREKGHRLVEHRRIAGHLYIVIHHVRQPGQVIGEACPHAAPRRRMPPVLHIPFLKLPSRGAQDVRARHLRLRIHECHHVLQLVAESVRASALIDRRARPHPAGERLVQRPSVDDGIEERLRRTYRHYTESLLPDLNCLGQRGGGTRRIAIPLEELERLPLCSGSAEDCRDRSSFAGRELNGCAEPRTRVYPEPSASTQIHAPHPRGDAERTVAPNKLAAFPRV